MECLLTISQIKESYKNKDFTGTMPEQLRLQVFRDFMSRFNLPSQILDRFSVNVSEHTDLVVIDNRATNWPLFEVFDKVDMMLVGKFRILKPCVFFYVIEDSFLEFIRVWISAGYSPVMVGKSHDRQVVRALEYYGSCARHFVKPPGTFGIEFQGVQGHVLISSSFFSGLHMAIEVGFSEGVGMTDLGSQFSNNILGRVPDINSLDRAVVSGNFFLNLGAVFMEPQSGSLNKKRKVKGKRALERESLDYFVTSLSRSERLQIVKNIKQKEKRSIQDMRDKKNSKHMSPQAGIFGRGIGVDEATFIRFDELMERFERATSGISIEASVSKPTRGLIHRFINAFKQQFTMKHDITLGVREVLSDFNERLDRIAAGGIPLNFKVPWTKILMIICGLGAAYYAVVNRDKTLLENFKVLIGPVLLCLGIASVDKIVSYVSKINLTDMEPQAIGASLLAKIASVAYLVFTTIFTGFPTDVKAFDKFFTKLSLFEKFKSGSVDIIALAISTVEAIFNFVRTKIFGWDKVDFIEKTVPGLQDWCEQVEEIVEKSHVGELELNSENARLVYKLDKTGRELETSKLLQASDKLEVRMAMNAYKAALRALVQKFESANLTGNGTRMEPLAVLVIGQPGVGKTQAMEPVIRKILMQVLPESEKERLLKNYYDFVYNRQGEHQYYDGYRGQFVTTIDEFGQCRDIIGNPDNEYMGLIRMVNRFPMMCHMADLGSKGTTPFVSKIVFATSNVMSIDPVSIVQPEAVARRFDIVSQCVPKREYSINNEVDINKRRLDMSLPCFKEGKPVSDIHEYHLMSVSQDGKFNRTGFVISEDEFVSLSVEKFNRKAKTHEEYVKYLEGIMTPQADIEPMTVVDDANTAGLDEKLDLAFLSDIITTVGSDADSWCSVELMYGDFIACYSNLPDGVITQVRRRLRSIRSILPLAMRLSDADLTFLCVVTSGYQMSYLLPLHVLIERFSELSEKEVVTDIGCSRVLRCYIGQEGFTRVKIDRCLVEAVRLLKPVLRSSLYRYVRGTLNSVRHLAQMNPYLWSIIRHCLLTLGSIAVLGPMLYQAVRWLVDRGDKKTEIAAQKAHTLESGPVRFKDRGGQKRFVRDPKLRAQTRVLQPEAPLDRCANQVADKVLTRSMYEVLIMVDNEPFRLGHGLFVSGKVFMMPCHYYHIMENRINDKDVDVDKFTPVRLVSLDKERVIKTTVGKLVNANPEHILSDQDIYFVEVSNAHNHPDLSTVFLTEEQLTKTFELDLIVAGWRQGSKHARYNLVAGSKISNQRVRDSEFDYVVDEGVTYKSDLDRGDCGSVTILVNPAISPGKILGMHVAGSPGMGFTVFTPKEMVDAILEDFKHCNFPPPEEVVNMKPHCSTVPFHGNFVPYCKTDKPVSQPVSTSKRRSKIHGLVMENKVAPAMLRPFKVGDKIIDPKVMAIEKYGIDYGGVLPQDVENKALHSVRSHILSCKSNFLKEKPFVLTFEEACKGVQGIEYLKSLPRNTSAGYPYVMNPVAGCRGKEYFFGKGEDYDFSSPQCQALRLEVESVIHEAHVGVRKFHVYVDSLKDECRPFDKVKQGKTRLISCSPIVLAIATRMYFGHFNSFMMRNALQTGVGVGLNPFSQDWDSLSRRLNSKSGRGFAGDQRAYDAKHVERDIRSCLKIINDYYDDGPTNSLVRLVLIMDVINSIHICGDVIYQWVKSLPSGSVLTTILNCLIGHLKFNQCWFMLRPNDEKFYDHVYLSQTGDDNVLGVSDSALVWYNQVTVSIAMSKLGYEYTDEDKNEVSVKSKPISELGYLKRGFRYEPYLGRVVAPLHYDSIAEMLNWTSKGLQSTEITKTNCETALSEISLHGRQDFRKWAPVLEQVAREHLSYELASVDWHDVIEKTTKFQAYY